MLKLKQLMPGMFISLSFAMVSSVGSAAVVNPDNGDPVMSITGLEVCISSDEICAKTQEELEQNEIQTIGIYDVVFEFGSFNDIFDNPTDSGFVGSCDNGLCFWENQGQANRAIQSLKDIEGNSINGTIGISEAMNMLDPTPEFVFGTLEVPNDDPPPLLIELPIESQFYLVPISFDGDMTITSRKGDFGGTSWGLQSESETNDTVEFEPYAHFSFTGMTREVLPIPPDPPDTPDVPEPSGLMGILFTASSMLIAIKKKN